MVSRNSYIFSLTLFCVLFLTSEGQKKGKRNKENSKLFPKYEIHQTDQLPRDKQISTFLHKDEKKLFFYSSTIKDAPLSITVSTCTSPINWSVKLQNISTPQNVNYSVGNLTNQDVQTLHITPVSKGVYILEIAALKSATYVHIYVSTEPGGPQVLQSTQIENVLKLLKRQQGRKLTVRWDPSLVDPHVTEYCLVVNKQKHYSTLCSAHGERYGIFPPLNNENKPMAASQTVTAWTSLDKANVILDKKEKEPLIACVGPKTHFTLADLQQNHGYFLDLFAINRQSNMTYLYGSTFRIFDKRTKPTRLRDNKSTYINLRKLDGKAVFRYKVGKILSESLKLYIMPCGGAVDINVSLKGKGIATRKKIEGFGRLVIPNPQAGSRYYIKILSSNKEELRRISGVEILGTTKPSSSISLPNMPLESSVQEYISLRKCDSVTVGWLASPEERTVRYCLLVREGKLREINSFKMPNQCGLENRLKKSTDFTVQYCRDVEQENEQVITQKITQLKSGKSYVVQVTVKKRKGKTLSYDLLQVNTKPTCEEENLKEKVI